MPARSSIADADRPAQRIGAEFRQENRDADSDGDADQHGDQRGDDGAVDRSDRAEFLGYRVPALGGEEAKAELSERRQRPEDQRKDDAAENNQDEDCSSESGRAERAFGPHEAAERLGPALVAADLAVGAQRNLGHPNLRPVHSLCAGNRNRGKTTPRGNRLRQTCAPLLGGAHAPITFTSCDYIPA